MRSRWIECELGDVVTLKRGYDLPERTRRAGRVPVVSSSGITGYHDSAKAEGPGVVTGRYGTLGEVFYVPGDFWPLNTSLYVKDFKGNDARFVAYLLRTLDFARRDGAAAVPGVNRNVLHLLPVRRPPLTEQRAISVVLSTYDHLIGKNTRRIEILEEMMRALYREWFVDLRDPVRASAPLSSAQSEPNGWSSCCLGDIARDHRRAVDPGALHPDTPYVGLEHIPRRSIALSQWGRAADVQSTKLAFNRGDILFGKIRPYFHKVAVAPVEGICSTDAIVVAAKQPEWYSLVLACVSSDAFIAHATQTSNGTKMPRANWDLLLQYPLRVPPDPLLRQFDEFVRNVVAQVRNLLMRNRNLRATRDLLLPKLISGEIDVSRLCPNAPAESPEEVATVIA